MSETTDTLTDGARAVAELRERLNEATDGDWYADYARPGAGAAVVRKEAVVSSKYPNMVILHRPHYANKNERERTWDDGMFVVAAKNRLPAVFGYIDVLAAERDAARAEVGRLTAERDDYRQQVKDNIAVIRQETEARARAEAELARVRAINAEYEQRMRAAEATNGTEKLREAVLNACDNIRQKLPGIGWYMGESTDPVTREHVRLAHDVSREIAALESAAVLATAPTADRGNQGEVQAYQETQG